MLSKRLVYLVMLVNLVTLVMLPGLVTADPISNMENNLQMSMADIIMVILSCGLVVISAFDTRIALMSALLLYTSVFILFTVATEEGYTGFTPYYSGVAMMLCFVLLAISLLVTYKKSNTPLNVV